MTSVLSPQQRQQQQQQQEKKPSLSTTHPFTCNTCQVAFRVLEAQRTHYHTDWHQYNLKRKVASLPPLSSETFAEKVLHAQTNTRLERERATFEKSCTACNKTYYSENGYANHVGSHRHRQNVAAAQMNAIRSGKGAVVSVTVRHNDKDETGSIVSSTFSLGEPVGEESASAPLAEKVETLIISSGSTATPSSSAPAAAVEAPAAPVPEAEAEAKDVKLPLEACLFCPYVSPSLALNVRHMTKTHGMFIPETNYLIDLPGLITYLGEKLCIGNLCLYCGKQKGGLEGVREHMQHKGHTMLGFETEEQQIELGQYYDFRSTYSDADEESLSSDEAKKDAPGAEDEWEDEVEDGDAAEGEGWETDSDTSVDSTNLGSIPIDRVRGRRSEAVVGHRMQDGWHSHAHSHVYHDEYELHLPSGRSVGHRSLARYYRQNLRDHPIAPTRRAVEYRTLAQQQEEEGREEGGVEVGDSGEGQVLNRRERRHEARVVARRGNDLGMVGATTSQKSDVAKLHKLSQAEEQRGRRTFEARVNKKSNSQKHFRDPLLQ